VFRANLDQNDLDLLRTTKLKKSNKSGSTEYTYLAILKYNTFFARLFGKKNLDIGVYAKAILDQQQYDVALVLDTTGSMSEDNKMEELKKAADLFVSKFSSDGSIRISVVPFDTQVRLKNASFVDKALIDVANPIDLATDCSSLLDPYDQLICQQTQTAAAGAIPKDTCATTATTGTFGSTTSITNCVTYTNTTKTTTTTSKVTNSAGVVTSSSTVSSTTSYTPPTSASSLPQPLTSKPNDTITANDDLLGVDRYKWSGCVVDRQQPYDVSAETVIANKPATHYPKSYCAQDKLASILELTPNMPSVSSKINELEPAGNTNITIGVQWGIEALSPPDPLRAPNQRDRKKLMIVLTDGLNTQNRWTTDSNAIDERTKLACENAKAEDIEIVTVRLIAGNRKLLKECASSPKKYFEVTQSNRLSRVFEDIANQIKTVRLSG
jgi:Mg-chelatase subunit ChlD